MLFVVYNIFGIFPSGDVYDITKNSHRGNL